ncbi:MAG: DUF5777 family beta-barrel protein [Flavobacteriaceae bacterium]|jgi:hypothetical protein|nr:DUF5777 family beta-barrel protein [Flavobacteriaceae bacterium]
MKNYKILLFTFLMAPIFCFSQEKAKDSIEEKPERPAFESSSIIDNQTNVLFQKNTLEVMMQHRFGLIDEENSLLGIYGANSNIRIGLSYAFLDWVTVGYGITKKNRVSDFSLKVGILQQTRSGSTPLSATYYGNVGIDGRSGDSNDGLFITKQDRYSYFHQLIIARRFSPKVSLQIAPSFSHYNAVDFGYENDRFSVAFGGRIKISPQTSIIFDYSQPITSFEDDATTGLSYNNPGISLGAEFATSAHAFQIFITNYSGIVPQQNYMRNTNDFFDKGILIGFNITRVYNF